MKQYLIIAVVIVIVGALVVLSNNAHTQSSSDKEMAENPKTTVTQGPNTILIADYSYGPEKLTVKKGTTVTWINKDIAKHTVTVEEGTAEGPQSEFFGKEQEYSYTFTSPGVYNYYCEPHPYMKGIVEVTE